MMDCAAKFKFNYIDGIRTPGGAPMRRGTAYHNVLECMLQYKIDTHGELMDKDKADRLAVKEGKKQKLTDIQIYQVIDAVRFYYDELYPKHRPISVEDKFEITRAGIKITGRIDLIEDDGYITDHKFSYDIWAEDRARLGSQPIVYQWAGDDWMEQKYGIPYKGFKYNIIRLWPSPMIQTITIDRIPEEDSLWWEQQLVNIMGAMRSGYYPARVTIKNKDEVCKYCDYKKLCKPATYKVQMANTSDTTYDGVRDCD